MAVLSGGGLVGGWESIHANLARKLLRVLLLFSTQGWGRGPLNVVGIKDREKERKKKIQIILRSCSQQFEREI